MHGTFTPVSSSALRTPFASGFYFDAYDSDLIQNVYQFRTNPSGVRMVHGLTLRPRSVSSRARHGRCMMRNGRQAVCTTGSVDAHMHRLSDLSTK